MIKKTVKYEDFNGDVVKEDLYFHLSKAELMDLEVGSENKFSDRLTKVTETEDAGEVLSVFKEILQNAYGERSEDGKRFVKNSRIREEFASSEAYSELLYELISNPDEAARFVNGLLPASLMEEAESRINSGGDPKQTEALKKMKALSEERKKEEEKDEAPKDLSSLSQEELIKMLESK